MGRPRRAASRRPLRVALPLALLSSACADTPPALEVGGVVFTTADVAGLTTAQVEHLADLAAFGSAVADGRTDSLIAPRVRRQVTAARLERLAAEVAAEGAGLDEAALRRIYDGAPEPELVVRHLVVLAERWRAPSQRDSARARAAAALERIRSGEPFADVAADVSEEPGAAARGGLLRPGRAGSWVAEFWQAALSLAPGGVSDVVETEYGFHVLRLEERRAVPFEEARPRLVDRLASDPVHAQRWLAERAGELRLEPASITAWRENRDHDAVLARFPTGDFRGAELDDYLLSLSEEESARLAAAPDESFIAVVGAAARNAYLSRLAGQRGIDVAAREADAWRHWRQQVADWARDLGFRPGQNTASLRRASLDALGATRQSAMIARAAVAGLRPVLRRSYPAVVPGA
jgi:hypothetical protein